MTYKKALTDASTRTPEQQRAVQTGSRHPGQRPKNPSPEKTGVKPDEAGEKRRENLEKAAANRR
jgi:hypothetical protein